MSMKPKRKLTPAGERLHELYNILDIEQRNFANIIGISTKKLSSICYETQTISYEVIQAIITAYPQVSREWLARGAGEPLLSEIQDDINPNFGKCDSRYRSIVKQNQDQQKEIARLKTELSEAKELISKLQDHLKKSQDAVLSLSRSINYSRAYNPIGYTGGGGVAEANLHPDLK